MDITKAIEIIKEYGNGIGETDILLTLDNMGHDEHKSNLERCAYNLFMHEGRKMFESVKVRVEI
jgi:hypothetical protein